MPVFEGNNSTAIVVSIVATVLIVGAGSFFFLTGEDDAMPATHSALIIEGRGIPMSATSANSLKFQDDEGNKLEIQGSK